jgi:hypothetical protein
MVALAAGGRAAESAVGLRRKEEKEVRGRAAPSDDTKKGGWRAALFGRWPEFAESQNSLRYFVPAHS